MITTTRQQIAAQLPPLATAREVAALFRVKVKTVYRWSQKGRLHTCHIGRTCRFTPFAVAAMIADEEE